LYLVILVVASIYDQRRVMSQSRYVRDAFLLDRFQDLRESWVVATAEHEVLPNQYAKLIAKLVKDVFLPDTATPDSDHDLIAVDHHFEPFAILVFRDSRCEIICRDPVRASAEYVHVVDAEEERLANFVRLLHQLALTETGTRLLR
jgi:hypothetical protein